MRRLLALAVLAGTPRCSLNHPAPLPVHAACSLVDSRHVVVGG